LVETSPTITRCVLGLRGGERGHKWQKKLYIYNIICGRHLNIKTNKGKVLK